MSVIEMSDYEQCDDFEVESAGTVEILIGDYTAADYADTALIRYVNIGARDLGASARGYHISSTEAINIIEVNKRVLKSPIAIAADGYHQQNKGNWSQLKIQTTTANTKVRVIVIA